MMPARIPATKRRTRLRRPSPRATRKATCAPRFGLAPLEMILGLPIILLLFALMINASFTGMWKLRLLGASQEVAWRERGSRTMLPPPDYRSEFWRQPEELDETAASTHTAPIEPLDIPAHESNADLSSAPAVRVDSNALQVVTKLLDPTKSTFEGTAHLNRHFPLLQDGLPMLRNNPHHQLTRNSLPFWNMEGQGAWTDSGQEATHVILAQNVARRTKMLYDRPGVIYPELGRCEQQIRHIDVGHIHPSEVKMTRQNVGWPVYEKAAKRVEDALNSFALLPLGDKFDITGPHGCPCKQNLHIDREAYYWAQRFGKSCQPFKPPDFMPQLPGFMADAVVTRRDSKYVREMYAEPQMVRVEDDKSFEDGNDGNNDVGDAFDGDIAFEGNNAAENEPLIEPQIPHKQKEDEFYPRQESLPHTLAGSYSIFFQRILDEDVKIFRLTGIEILTTAERTALQAKIQSLQDYQTNF